MILPNRRPTKTIGSSQIEDGSRTEKIENWSSIRVNTVDFQLNNQAFSLKIGSTNVLEMKYDLHY